jgi:hypothetical protein
MFSSSGRKTCITRKIRRQLLHGLGGRPTWKGVNRLVKLDETRVRFLGQHTVHRWSRCHKRLFLCWVG